PTAEKVFITGKAPIFSMGSWEAGSIQTTAPNGNFGVMLFPTVDGGKGTPDGLVIGDTVFIVTKASQHPDEAKKFIQYLASEEAQKIWSEDTQALTPYTYDASSWKFSPRIKAVSDIANSTHSAEPFLDVLEDQSCNVPWIWQGSEGVLSGDLTPQQAGDGHQDCIDKL